MSFFGHWKGSTEEWFSTDPGWGFTAGLLKGLSLRWDWGVYLGYMAIPGTTDYFDPMDATTRYAILNRMVRGGGSLRVAIRTGPKLRMGVAWELGLLAFRRAAPGGLEGAFDLFVDFPVTAGPHRLTLTIALGFRGNVAYRDESPNLYGYQYQTETWMIAPMLRVGLGWGR